MADSRAIPGVQTRPRPHPHIQKPLAPDIEAIRVVDQATVSGGKCLFSKGSNSFKLKPETRDPRPETRNPLVVLGGGWAVSCERGTPVLTVTPSPAPAAPREQEDTRCVHHLSRDDERGDESSHHLLRDRSPAARTGTAHPTPERPASEHRRSNGSNAIPRRAVPTLGPHRSNPSGLIGAGAGRTGRLRPDPESSRENGPRRARPALGPHMFHRLRGWGDMSPAAMCISPVSGASSVSDPGRASESLLRFGVWGSGFRVHGLDASRAREPLSGRAWKLLRGVRAFHPGKLILLSETAEKLLHNSVFPLEARKKSII